ncbi:unnamed protein product [Dovyalis caffra]|uniref:Uncharacterized protein n=1 Tax=Dovyalis caffra TaxID=77055 RepID=A0AAV1RHN9_9ROSI|nr:unnamed protein product [Dovyalis caffra]
MLIYACGCIEPYVHDKAYKFNPIVDVGANKMGRKFIEIITRGMLTGLHYGEK